MLFLRSPEIFISSKSLQIGHLSLQWLQIGQLCTTAYQLLDYFEFYSVCSCNYTQISNKHELPLSIFLKQTPLSCGMALPHINGASDFAIRKVSVNPNKDTDYSLYELKIAGTSSRTADFCKSKMHYQFLRAYSTVSKR